MRQQQRLKLGRRDLVPVVLDELLAAVDDVEVAVRVDGRDVARLEPRCSAVRRGGEGSGCRGRVV